MITSVQVGILQEVDKQHQDEHEITATSNQMPPQNISLPPQQQQQLHTEHQMSQILVGGGQHAGIGSGGISMADQHQSHPLDQHAHAMSEHASHSMMDLSEGGNSLEHLAGGGHGPQSLVDLTSGRVSDQSLDSVVAAGRRQSQPQDRISGLSDGNNPPLRLVNNDRDISSLSGGAGGNVNNNGTLISRPLSGLGGSSLADRQSQPMRNLTPVGIDNRQHGGSMTDGRGSVGLGRQNLSGGGGSLQDSRSTSSQPLSFSPEHSSQGMLNPVPIIPRRGRPPTVSRIQHNLGSINHSLSQHMRSLHDQATHSHSSLVDHGIGGDSSSSSSRNGRTGMPAFGMDNGEGQLHSRPGSTLLPESNNHADGRDLSRSGYSTSSGSGDRLGSHQSSSLIEETIAAVASNLNKNSSDGGIMPGPLPPNSLTGLGVLGLARSGNVVSHLGHSGDDSLADLVGRHHMHSIPLLSERASQSLSGLIDEHSVNHASPGHSSQGRELEKTHPCMTCLKMFRSKQQLAQHTLVHTGIRKHICSFCDRAFKQLSHLQQHVRIHTGERKYICSLCEKGFKQLSHLQQHFRIHTDERKYICSCCEKGFKQLSHLQQHYRIHTGERKYVCQICNRAFKQMTHLQQHHIIHTGERKYVCQVCSRAFKQMTHLQQHLRIHTGERKYICQICNRAFKQLTHLQKHHVIHTGERKYVCQCCERAFKQLTHLQQHYRIHTGEKPYRCKFENCERAFAQLSNLQHHMRNHDDQVKKEATRIHKCQICHRCYTNESSLKAHTLKMHVHIKPIDQHATPIPKKRRKHKNKDLYGGAPTMVPVSSTSDGAFQGPLVGMKASSSRTRTPSTSSSSGDDDEIIFVGEQIGPPRMDNFGGPVGSLGGQVQMLQGPGGRGHDLSHQIPFSGMGNFSRGADPLALLASANRFSLQDNMMSGLAGPLNSFSDQLTFRDAALLNSRFGDLRGGPSQGGSFDDRFPSGNFSQQQQQLQRDRDGFGNHNDVAGRGGGGGSSNGNSGDNVSANDGNSSSAHNQIPAHNQGMLRGAGVGGLGPGMGGLMGAGQAGLGGLMKQIKQEPLEYFPSSCHGGDQFAGMGVSSGGGFLSPQHLINSHLRGQLPSLNVPLIRDHFPHSQMLPHTSSSSASSGSSSTPLPVVPPSTTPNTSIPSTTPSSLASLPLPLTHMGIYHQPHFQATQRMTGLHPSPASTPSSQLSVGANLSSNLSSQGARSPLEQEDLRCFSPLRN